ncbi:MAG: GNAT family N-acetyltransferase [Candidatus Thorarchaeota archaeon]
MNQDISLRKMTTKDWDAFHRFDVLAFPDDTMSEEFFFKRLDRDGFFSLDLKGEMIGQLIISPFGENEGHLGRIAIAPTHQGQGYGNVLLQEAMKWFKDHSLTKVHLYTQDHNKVAQSLYRKFGFEKSGTTWHYFVPLETLRQRKQFKCQPIELDEIEVVGMRYASLPAAQIRRFLEFSEHPVFTLKDDDGSLKGACRFTPSFPGCFPFELDEIDGLDDFLLGLKPYSLPEYDYIRITFVDNEKLSVLCKERGYRLHHRLFKMTASIT